MVTKEQVVNGILMYADNEIMTQLPTAGKWGLGAVLLLSTNKVSEIVDVLASNTIVKSMGLIDENGQIDIDSIAMAFMQSAEKYGKVEMNVPVLGTMVFGETDVEKLHKYIEGGSK